MEYRFLGSTGVRVSKVSFGTMTFGGEADMAASREMFSLCLDRGINVFDCADVYHGGESERILGTLLRESGCRDNVVVTSKGYFPTGSGQNERGSSRYHLVRTVEQSLRRLQTDRLDIFFLHRWDALTDLDDTLRTLDMLVRSGKILYPAISNFSAWQTALAVERCKQLGLCPPACIQPMYNLVKRQAEVEILPMAQHTNLGVMPYSPLGGGLLTGKYALDRSGDGRLTRVKMYATRYSNSEHYETAARFIKLAKEVGMDPVTLAVAWVAHHPAVTSPLLGARNVEQLAPAIRAGDICLEPELYERVSSLSLAPAPATDRNEEKTADNFGNR
ncbi:MAG: aldo/keto reductase [Myxococcota bacterium]|nr:aldo/keto reductase [Myxococcota bacterium]